MRRIVSHFGHFNKILATLVGRGLIVLVKRFAEEPNNLELYHMTYGVPAESGILHDAR